MDDERLAELLVRAVGSLPDDDRGAVLVELVRRGLNGPPAAVASTGGTHQPWRRGNWSGFLDVLSGAPAPPLGDRRNVLVRLDAAQHERLKEWCQGHDFTMATVLRGLVDQFLETQTEPAGAVTPD